MQEHTLSPRQRTPRQRTPRRRSHLLLPQAWRRRRGQQGVSLIELLIATAILTFIAIGILPMLVRSLANNNRGWESTLSANHVKSVLEEAINQPLEGAAMQVASGQTETITTTEYATGELNEVGDTGEGWVDGGTTTGGEISWVRNIRVRYFSADDLPPWPGSKGEVWTPTPLDGNTPSPQVHMKEIQVSLQTTREGGTLGAGQWVTVQVFKSF